MNKIFKETKTLILRMSEITQNSKSKKFQRKAGKTLLVKAKEGKTIDESWLSSLDGLVSEGVSKTEKTGSFFLTFSEVGKSLDALKQLKKDHDDDLMVKFAHYRVFFKFNNGLDSKVDYNVVKETHVKFVKDNTNSEVLYYKLYRGKDGNFLGCGDMTLDTKDALDNLLSKDHNKEFDLGDNMSGVFYRYDRKGGNKQEGEVAVAN